MNKAQSSLLITLVSCSLLFNNTGRANAQIVQPIMVSSIRSTQLRLPVKTTTKVEKNVMRHIAKETGLINIWKKIADYAEKNGSRKSHQKSNYPDNFPGRSINTVDPKPEKLNDIENAVVSKNTTNVLGAGGIVVVGGQKIYCTTTAKCGTPDHRNALTKDSVCDQGGDSRRKDDISQACEAATEKNTKADRKLNKGK